MLSSHYTLNGIKSKTVGDGQYGPPGLRQKRKSGKYMPMCPMNQSNGELESIFQKKGVGSWIQKERKFHHSIGGQRGYSLPYDRSRLRR